MKTTGHKIQSMGLSLLLCSTIQAWGYTNPIDGPTTETVTNLWDLGTEGLLVGVTTSGNAMIITNGGRLISSGGWFGSPYGSVNNRVTVTGVGSTWINSGIVDLYSHDNELLIVDGGRVDSIGGSVGGSYSPHNNLVTISGAGSIWSNSAGLNVGGRGFNNGVIITNGGQMYSNGGRVGDEPAGGYLVVSGPGSVYKNAGHLATYASTLLINDGGRMENTTASPWFSSTTVTGVGSTWINSGELSMNGGEVVISNGGRVESNGGHIGLRSEAKATVTGAGSTWVDSGQFRVSVGEFVVSDGGQMKSSSSSVGGTARVIGIGSMWNNIGNFEVGSSGSVTVSNGGTISTASLVIQTNIYDSGSGAFHLQSGGKLAVSGDFNAAQSGTFDFTGGTLSVGGTLTNLSMLAADCRLEAANLSGDLTVHGTFAPGQSPADTMLDGAFVLAGDGELEMEIAGYLLGTEYDRLTVTGASMLDGTLAVILLDDYSPVYGASFDLFNWNGGVSGTFAVTNLPALGNGLFWDTGSLYTDGTVTVVPEPSTALLLGMGLTAFGVYALRNKVYEF